MMKTTFKISAMSLMALGLAACESVPNVMDMPANFQEQSDKIRIKGARAWKLWGTLSLADAGAEAKYKRSASTTTWFETFETKKAKAKFDLAYQGKNTKAKCVMRQEKMYLGSRNFGVIGKFIDPSLTTSPMKYVCEFTGTNIPSDAAFILAQVQSNNLRVFGNDEVRRYGFMDWDGVLLEFESGHRLKGAQPSLLEDFIPAMGYFIYEGPDMIAAIDLEAKQFLYIEPGVSLKQREAIMIATTALALHTDPVE